MGRERQEAWRNIPGAQLRMPKVGMEFDVGYIRPEYETVLKR